MRLAQLSFAPSNAHIAILLAACFCSVLPVPSVAQSSSDNPATAISTGQDSFASPQWAADAVHDKNRIDAFAAKAREKKSVTIDPTNGSRAILSVGNDNWPFPVPIV